MDGEVSRQTFDCMDDKSKLGVLYDRTYKMCKQDEKILERLDTIDAKLKRHSFWSKAYSAIGGFFGGLVAAVSLLIWRI